MSSLAAVSDLMEGLRSDSFAIWLKRQSLLFVTSDGHECVQEIREWSRLAALFGTDDLCSIPGSLVQA